MRVDRNISTAQKEVASIKKDINGLHLDMSRLNELIHSNTDLHQKLANENYALETEFVEELKEMEAESVKVRFQCLWFFFAYSRFTQSHLCFAISVFDSTHAPYFPPPFLVKMCVVATCRPRPKSKYSRSRRRRCYKISSSASVRFCSGRRRFNRKRRRKKR